MIKLKILTTEITSYELVNRRIYNFSATDIFNRLWRYTGDSNSSGEFEIYNDIQKLQIDVKNDGYIDTKLYWVYSDDDYLKGKRFDSVEKVLDVFSNSNTDYEPVSWQLHATTEGGLYYKHDKVFKDFSQFKKFAMKVKKKDFVNLKYWICMGSYDYNDSTAHEEFEEKYEYYENPEDIANRAVLDMIESDRLPDGTVPGYRD